ncbi:MAG TPA: outer membrane beta-barrel protein [Hyphomonadaceae bacterium]|nr:outer membrane beta-barrel protein [Hyphomonadaceae bacterium]
MKFGFKHLALSSVMASALAAVITPAALAQSNPFQDDRYTSVTQRQQPQFDPEPIHAGAFVVDANAGLAAELNDNVFATDSNTVSDTILRFTPQIDARSNWTTHALNAGLAINHNEHLEEDSETSTDYTAYVDGRIDVTRVFQFTGRIDAAQQTEPRYEPGNDGQEPTQINRTGLTAGVQYQTDRLQLRGSVGSSKNNYSTDPVNLVDRDFDETFFSGRASFAFSPDLALFVQGRKSKQDYSDNSREGERTSYEVGATFELAAPFRGEIAVGTVNEEKDNGQDFDGLSLDAKVEWFPTELTTVTFSGVSKMFDPGLQLSSSALNTTYGVRIDHEFYRNVLLFGDASFGTYDYDGIDRQDDFSDLAFGAAWKLNKHARLEGSYRFHSTQSDGGAADPLRLDVSQNVFSVGVRVYP